MLCVLEQRDGKWYCINCNGHPLGGGRYKRQCKANGQHPKPAHVDAVQWFTTYYAKQELSSPPLAGILARLERCRSAGCVGLQNDVCTALGSSPCKQRAVWFSMLTGDAACQHWKPIIERTPRPVPPDSPTLTLILGPHRSLSSCLAGMLEKLGVFLGADTIRGECQTLAALCEHVMPFPSTEFADNSVMAPTFRKAAWKRWYREHVAASDGKPLAAKYPHLAAFQDDILAAVPNVRIIRIRRPLEESIASLVSRSAAHPDSQWRATPDECDTAQRFLDAEADAWPESIPRLELNSQDLLSNPALVVQKILSFLGIDPTDHQRWEATAHVRPSWAAHTRASADDRWTETTTVCVKAFERPEALAVCLRSIRDRYPRARILVADDSRQPHPMPGVETIVLPYDTGLSGGRNAMARACRTERLLIVDDDMIFTSGTNIQALHDAVSQGVDLAAGRVIGRRGQIRAFEGHFVRSPEELAAMPGPDGEHPCGLPRYHVLENFYLARTEHLLRFPYDAELKVGEHMDWLISMWLGNARLTIVDDVHCIDPAFRPRNGDATQYTQMRERATRLWRAAMKKRGAEMGFARFVQRLYPYQRPLIVDCRVALERKSS